MNLIKKSIITTSLILLFIQTAASQEGMGGMGMAAQTPVDDGINRVEITLVDPLDDRRGWCVDLFGHLTNGILLGGLQGHNCFLYMGRGVTEDQGFDADRFADTGELQLVYYDKCMTLYERNSGSFVSVEDCNGEDIQNFVMSEVGEIKPKAQTDLCLTLGDLSIPGGGRLAPEGTRPPESNKEIHQIRRLTFTTCSESIAGLQRWEFRSNYAEQELTQPHRFYKGE